MLVIVVVTPITDRVSSLVNQELLFFSAASKPPREVLNDCFADEASWPGNSLHRTWRHGGRLMQITALRSSMMDQTTTGTVSQERSAVGAKMPTCLMRMTLVTQELLRWK